jgi:hypothetical protein
MIDFPFMLLFGGYGDPDTVCSGLRELPRGVRFQVISVGGVPGTSSMGLGYSIPYTLLE